MRIPMRGYGVAAPRVYGAYVPTAIIPTPITMAITPGDCEGNRFDFVLRLDRAGVARVVFGEGGEGFV
jgi:hypothetical protein